MTNFITQLILAARRRDDDGWTSFVPLVIMAAIWIVGGIMKAKANKIKDLDYPEEAEEQARPESKEPQQPKQAQKPRRPIAVYQAGDRPKSIDARGTVREKTVDVKPAKLKLQPSRPQVAPEIEAVPHPEKQDLGLKRKSKTAQKRDKEVQPAIRPLFSDEPDELKRAILYYEILGKPISLRDF